MQTEIHIKYRRVTLCVECSTPSQYYNWMMINQRVSFDQRLFWLLDSSIIESFFKKDHGTRMCLFRDDQRLRQQQTHVTGRGKKAKQNKTGPTLPVPVYNLFCIHYFCTAVINTELLGAITLQLFL